MGEILTRRNLPHWYRPGAAYFVTYRLAGTLPAEALERLRMLREKFQIEKPRAGETRTQQRVRMHKQWFAAYDELLDQQKDVAFLRDPRVAAMIRGNLYHHNGIKYHLLAYCIMPNHVHLVLQLIESDETTESQDEARNEIGDRDDGISPLTKIMHSLKSYTAHEANKLLGRQGAFWQRESYDHWIREDELERIVEYVQNNPLKAGLVSRPEDWYWCSCHDRFLTDGEPTAWLGL